MRATASVRTVSTAELTDVAGAVYPLELFFYEVTPAPLVEALISASLAQQPQTYDAS